MSSHSKIIVYESVLPELQVQCERRLVLDPFSALWVPE